MAVKTNRKSYARLKNVFNIPNLLKIQIDSYDQFLQIGVPKTKRKKQGLEALFSEVFPIYSQDNVFKLEYLYYDIKQPSMIRKNVRSDLLPTLLLCGSSSG